MYQRQATFEEAVRSALQQHYCDFSGRASRSDYWWFVLFGFILGAITGVIAGFSETLGGILNVIVGLGLLLPSLGLAVRRLHDTGRSGWWIFISLIPLVGQILLLVWLCQESQMTPNQYGPTPHVENR
ncbi:MAG: DUF805 domain-containing protein [Muribaculaceae bacterium]|nr:DUF805 domain-containing protein [Muribaculaceae bacterium]MCI9053697.1 DUF805 domain-containing protein [Muribaculaceae bacterium]